MNERVTERRDASEIGREIAHAEEKEGSNEKECGKNQEGEGERLRWRFTTCIRSRTCLALVFCTFSYHSCDHVWSDSVDSGVSGWPHLRV